MFRVTWLIQLDYSNHFCFCGFLTVAALKLSFQISVVELNEFCVWKSDEIDLLLVAAKSADFSETFFFLAKKNKPKHWIKCVQMINKPIKIISKEFNSLDLVIYCFCGEYFRFWKNRTRQFWRFVWPRRWSDPASISSLPTILHVSSVSSYKRVSSIFSDFQSLYFLNMAICKHHTVIVFIRHCYAESRRETRQKIIADDEKEESLMEILLHKITQSKLLWACNFAYLLLSFMVRRCCWNNDEIFVFN